MAFSDSFLTSSDGGWGEKLSCGRPGESRLGVTSEGDMAFEVVLGRLARGELGREGGA